MTLGLRSLPPLGPGYSSMACDIRGVGERVVADYSQGSLASVGPGQRAHDAKPVGFDRFAKVEFELKALGWERESVTPGQGTIFLCFST